MDSPFWENAIAAQFRHVAGSIGSCRNRAAWQESKQWMPPSGAMDSPFWENVIAAQFRHVAGSISSRFLPPCRNRTAW